MEPTAGECGENVCAGIERRPLAAGGVEVRKRIADALVALQFQDRVSQILDHTARDLDKLRQHIATGTLDGQVIASWQAEMAANFSTHEEFASVDGTQGKRESNNVTFY